MELVFLPWFLTIFCNIGIFCIWKFYIIIIFPNKYYWSRPLFLESGIYLKTGFSDCQGDDHKVVPPQPAINKVRNPLRVNKMSFSSFCTELKPVKSQIDVVSTWQLVECRERVSHWRSCVGSVSQGQWHVMLSSSQWKINNGDYLNSVYILHRKIPDKTVND